MTAPSETPRVNKFISDRTDPMMGITYDVEDMTRLAYQLERELAVARGALEEITDVEGCSSPRHLADETLTRLDEMSKQD